MIEFPHEIEYLDLPVTNPLGVVKNTKQTIARAIILSGAAAIVIGGLYLLLTTTHTQHALHVWPWIFSHNIGLVLLVALGEVIVAATTVVLGLIGTFLLFEAAGWS